ncbi:acyltransferase [Geomonas azotofigens]|uniref:acyltransferase n=1 Tax=Geomonas azotofigens TaxID=2843196 RepID=UPI001C0F70D3|nr:acyltransferase [Geomonas azotofigens]MBU5613370.1 N-acetyltransferase [Geomonas azotofigens]
MANNIFIHPSANVAPSAQIGDNTKIWINSQIRENTRIGANCIISKDTYLDFDVVLGDNCKLQNGVSVYHGVTIEEDVFVGPYAVFTNDKVPRAFNADWQVTPTVVKRGASIGANATIVCGVTLGEYCMVAAGSVVTKDVEPYSLVVGNPARHYSYVDKMGNKVARKEDAK